MATAGPNSELSLFSIWTDFGNLTKWKARMAQGASPLKLFPKALAHNHALSAGPPNLYLTLIDVA